MVQERSNFCLTAQQLEKIESGLFFITGTGRCGSTLLQSMLMSHSRIFIPPETGFFWKFDPSIKFEDPLPDSQVEEYIQSCIENWWWQALELDNEAFIKAVKNGMHSSRKVFLWLLWQLSKNTGKLRLGEKTSGHGLFIDKTLNWFPQAKFIHIYRDPRDVAASFRSQYWWTTDSIIPSAYHCRDVLARLKPLAEKLGNEQFLCIQYEKLINQPEVELRRVCEFLGERFEVGMLNFCERQQLGYVDVEADWKNLTRQSLTKSRIGLYRQRLKPREIKLVEIIVGSFLKDYGYQSEQLSYRYYWRLINDLELKIWQIKYLLTGMRTNFVDENRVKARRC